MLNVHCKYMTASTALGYSRTTVVKSFVRVRSCFFYSIGKWSRPKRLKTDALL